MSMEIHLLRFNPVLENTYILSDDSKECVIVDPGCLYPIEEQKLVSFVQQQGLRPVGVWFTHLHFDHAWGAAFCKEQWGIEAWASAADEFLIEANIEKTSGWGLPAVKSFTLEHYISDGERLCFGHSELTAIATPGHTPGGMSFYAGADGVCLTGDTLFRRSLGRTDFPEGSQEDIMNSVRSRLLTLPYATRVLPGHGPSTTIEEEITSNPYLTES